jgi:hypothetical protein
VQRSRRPTWTRSSEGERLFEGELTDDDQLVYVNGVLKGKLLENETLIQQAANNSKEQFANSPDLKPTHAMMQRHHGRAGGPHLLGPAHEPIAHHRRAGTARGALYAWEGILGRHPNTASRQRSQRQRVSNAGRDKERHAWDVD